jgi:hypothetical protein
MRIQGTHWDHWVEAPCEDISYDGIVRCIWCGQEFDYEDNGDWRCMEAMHHIADGSMNWDGEYIHSACDSFRHEATQEARRQRQFTRRQAARREQRRRQSRSLNSNTSSESNSRG